MPELLKQFKDMPPQEAETFIRQIAEADPTDQKIYTPWLIKQVRKGNLRLPEDQDRALNALRSFEQNKRVAGYPGPKDINQYKLFQDLETTLDKIGGQALKSKRQAKREVKEKGAKLVYDDGTYAIIEITEPEAAVIYSKGSKWCTSGAQTAAGYLKRGPIHVIFKNDEKIAQLHTTSHQLMDLTDRPYNFREDPGLRVALAKTIKPDNPSSAMFMSKVTGKRVPQYELQIMQDPRTAAEYARDAIGGRWPEAEPFIIQDPSSAANYARDVIKDRWPEAEPTIAKDPRTAIEYAKSVIKGPWPEAEQWMGVQDIWSAIRYVSEVLRKRWPKLEQALLQTDTKAHYGRSNIVDYVVATGMGRWPEGEQKLLEEANPATLYNYATRVVGGRWPEAEPIIARDMHHMIEYATRFVKGPWPEVEPAILKSNSDNIFAYITRVLKGPWPRFERAVLKSLSKFQPASDEWRDIARLGYKYARDIKQGHWPELETLIAADPDFATLYRDNMELWRARESK